VQDETAIIEPDDSKFKAKKTITIADKLRLHVRIAYITNDGDWPEHDAIITKLQYEETAQGGQFVRIIANDPQSRIPLKISLATITSISGKDEISTVTPTEYFVALANENNWTPPPVWPPRSHSYYKIHKDKKMTTSGYIVTDIYDSMMDVMQSPEWSKRLNKGTKTQEYTRIPRYWKHGNPAIYSFGTGHTFYDHEGGWDKASRMIQIEHAIPDKFNNDTGIMAEGTVEFYEYNLRTGNVCGQPKIIDKTRHKMTQSEFVKHLGITFTKLKDI